MKKKIKNIIYKTLLYKIFISLPLIFFVTFLFFGNFIRSIEFTITLFFSQFILTIIYEYFFNSKYRNYVIIFWFLFAIIGCILLKLYLK